HAAQAVARFPRGAKALGIIAPAVEARAVPGREGSRLVEKEQLGPASPAHHLAPAAAELAEAGDPGRTRPASFQQRLGRGVMDDAAVAREQPPMRPPPHLPASPAAP